MAPPLCLPLPFTLFLTFSATFPLSLSSLHTVSVILFWVSAETSTSPPLQPYSLSSLHLKFICKHGPVQTGCTSWPALVNYTLGFYITFSFSQTGSRLRGQMRHLFGRDNISLHLCAAPIYVGTNQNFSHGGFGVQPGNCLALPWGACRGCQWPFPFIYDYIKLSKACLISEVD